MNLRNLLSHASPDVLDLNADALDLPAREPATLPAATEEEEQIRLFQMVEERLAEYPDLILLVPRGQYHGMVCELKTQGGRLSPSQRAWLKALEEQGYRAVVAFGADEALARFVAYLNTNTC